MSDTPVVFLNGARQTGKSTLAQRLATSGHPARYVTLDDLDVLSAAKGDPQGFLAGFEGPVILDEASERRSCSFRSRPRSTGDAGPGASC